MFRCEEGEPRCEAGPVGRSGRVGGDARHSRKAHRRSGGPGGGGGGGGNGCGGLSPHRVAWGVHHERQQRGIVGGGLTRGKRPQRLAQRVMMAPPASRVR